MVFQTFLSVHRRTVNSAISQDIRIFPFWHCECTKAIRNRPRKPLRRCYMSIPLRDFGKTAVEIVHRALDGGITFYDNAWEYYRGKTESWLGLGIKGRRDQAFIMTKVCTHGRDGSLAMQMLEQSLRRLQTDHLDLWQVHGVVFQNDPELFIRPGGAAEALLKAKQQGKVRFVGFTGHKDPDVHLAMLNTGFPFDSVQMPLNAFDATYCMSFEQKVLPVLNQ